MNFNYTLKASISVKSLINENFIDLHDGKNVAEQVAVLMLADIASGTPINNIDFCIGKYVCSYSFDISLHE